MLISVSERNYNRMMKYSDGGMLPDDVLGMVLDNYELAMRTLRRQTINQGSRSSKKRK